MRMPDPKVVVITGASSGVGQATARLLSRRGYRVFGTSRDPARSEPIPAVEMVALDVRQDTSVTACLNVVLGRTGSIDVLINNAGYELAGASDELSLDDIGEPSELNLF